MQPERPTQPERSWLDRLWQRFDRFLSGSANSDPLYLSNRSWRQKLKLGALIAAPFLILGALAMVGATDIFRSTAPRPYEPPPVAEAHPAPARSSTSDPHLSAGDLEVVTIRLSKSENPPVVIGTLRNNSDQNVSSAEVRFDLNDRRGSRVGSDTLQIQNLAPHSTANFSAPVKVADAAFVLVREVHSN